MLQLNARLLAIAVIALSFVAFTAHAGGGKANHGLSDEALEELDEAGVFKYLGEYEPVSSEDVGDGWTKHTFDPDGGDGPICIAGTPYSVFTREGHSKRLLIFLQGGGACWQGFYFCNVLAEDQEPPSPRVGIWDFDNPANIFKDHSIVYMPYCDGSVHTGDNAVVDPDFPYAPVRHHRGLRNQSAGMDVAKAHFPNAKWITMAGSSAGGVGVAGFTPFLARKTYGRWNKMTVFNDAGPVTVNPDALGDIDARAADWDFGKFYPDSCTECDEAGDATEVIKWRLANDNTIREAIYETDFDETNRFFLGLLFDPFRFRELVIEGHGVLNDLHPDRYKRFIVSGDISHTALQTPLFYSQDANGVLLNEWARDFILRPDRWDDIVEDPQPFPAPSE